MTRRWPYLLGQFRTSNGSNLRFAVRDSLRPEIRWNFRRARLILETTAGLVRNPQVATGGGRVGGEEGGSKGINHPSLPGFIPIIFRSPGIF